MIIGIDIDNTLSKSVEGMIEHMQKNGHDIAFDDIVFHGTTLSAEEKGFPESFFLHQWHTMNEWLLDLELHDGAKMIIALLQEHEIHLVSARGRANQKVIDLTYDWLEKHNIHVTSFEPTKNKVASCKKLGIQVMVEDNPDEVKELVDAGIPVLLHDRPYNQDVEHPLVMRFTHWGEIPRLLKRIHKY